MTLGKTAGGLFWMFRLLERSENTARLIDAGFRLALTSTDSARDEWSSVIATAGVQRFYLERHDDYEASKVINFLLRDKDNPSSVLRAVQDARDNARMVRTALTREVWEAINECWMTIKDALARPVSDRDLPEVLSAIRHQSAVVRGALHGTMLRNDVYDFARLGTFAERADNTARILDVKYYVLLPSVSLVGSSLDNVQWETVLRSVSALGSFRWLHGGTIKPRLIANFLILDRRFPRSLAFCVNNLVDNLDYLEGDYDLRLPCHDKADELKQKLKGTSIDSILDTGLHEFISDFIIENAALARQIEKDFRFYE